jgi:hypothetical protein
VTRLTDLPPGHAKRLAELECPDYETRPWMIGAALPQRRVARFVGRASFRGASDRAGVVWRRPRHHPLSGDGPLPEFARSATGPVVIASSRCQLLLNVHGMPDILKRSVTGRPRWPNLLCGDEERRPWGAQRQHYRHRDS